MRSIEPFSLLTAVLYSDYNMIDNFFEDNYHSYDQIYQHPQTHKTIYLGDMQSALDDDFLSKKNIKTVVTAARDMEHIVLGEKIRHIVYPLIDGKNQNISNLFHSFYELVEQSIPKGNILVHCAAGISRSSTLVISYIMKKQRITFKDAIALVRKGRPSVLPNLGFQRQLKMYEKSMMKILPYSRSSKRSDIKTSQSSKRAFLNNGELLSNKLKDRMISLNMKKFVQKFSQKDIQILRIYNNKSFQHHSKLQTNKLKANKSIDEGLDLNRFKVDLPRNTRQSQELNNQHSNYRKRIKSKIMKQQENSLKGFKIYNKYSQLEKCNF